MSLRSALSGSTLQSHVQRGLQAVESKDHRYFEATSRKNAVDSLDLDDALRTEHPTTNRWDYIVSSATQLMGVEPHSAKNREVSVVVRKKRWAVQVLQAHLRTGTVIDPWYWVGRDRFHNKNTKVERQLKQAGITFRDKPLRIC